MLIKLITVLLVLFVAIGAYFKNAYFTGSVTSDGTDTKSLISSSGATLISRLDLEDSIPAIDITLGTECTLGVALVKAFGFTPTIQLIDGQPLVVPQNTVIASRVWEFTSLDYDVQTETPFLYDSNDDTTWSPLHLNQGDELLLLTILDCTGSAEVIYSGQVKWF